MADPASNNISNVYERIAAEALEGRRELLDSLGLTEEEKRLVIQWLSTALVSDQNDGCNPVHDLLWDVDYAWKPVDMRTFLEDERYLGLFTRDLHDNWKQVLDDVFSPTSQVYRLFLGGAIGTGKTTVAMVALTRLLYLMSCMKNPASYYGLLPNSRIGYGIFSVTKDVVGATAFAKIREFIDGSKYFSRYFPRKKGQERIDFKKHPLSVVYGSQAIHALGQDMFSVVIDEASFMRETKSADGREVKSQAEELSNAVENRIQSRFFRAGGVVPGLIIYISSKRAKTSFWERKASEADPETSKIVEFPLWAVKSKDRFSGRTFRVRPGDRTTPSKVLETPEDEKQEEHPERLIDVPIEFKQNFDRDTDSALRDIAGVATADTTRFIYDAQSLTDAEQDHREHPFSRESFTISTADDTMVEDFFKTRILCKTRNSRWVPRYHRASPRFIHIDHSQSGDCLGLAMVHLSGMRSVVKTLEDGTTTEGESPAVMADFMLRIYPPDGHQIDFSKVRAFIGYLKDVFPVQEVTMDSFQSTDTVQILKRAGMNARLLSVDRTAEPYLYLRAALSERRFLAYNYPPFRQEMLDLIRTPKGKVDHPSIASSGGKGSKDVSDAVAGATYAAINNDEALSLLRQLEQPEDAQTTGHRESVNDLDRRNQRKPAQEVAAEVDDVMRRIDQS